MIKERWEVVKLYAKLQVGTALRRRRPVLSRRGGRGRLGELCVVDRDVLLDLVNLNGGAPARPGDGPAEGRLDATRVAIIGVVNLRGVAAERRFLVPHQAHEQARLLVEVELHGRLAGIDSEDDVRLVVADLVGRPDAQLAEDLLDVHGKIEVGVELDALENTAAHLPRRHARVAARSEEHTSELQSRLHLVCRLLLEKKKKTH